MNRGIYAGAAGMYAQQQALDVLANNLANVNTTAFKSDRLNFREALDRNVYAPGESRPRWLGRLGGGALVEGQNFQPEQGSVVQTGNPLDVAIEGDGYFSVKGPQGIRYTRTGSFQLDAGRRLTTRDGLPVLGQNGEITVPPGQNASIDASGKITAGGKTLDTLAVVTGGVSKEGFNLYAGAARPATTTKLQTGALEGSNVNSVREMVAMIETVRTFEANQKVVQAHDETLQKAINDLARLS